MLADLLDRFADHPLILAEEARLSYAQALARGRALIGALPRDRSLVVLRCGLTPSALSAYVALLADGHVPLLVEDTLSEPLLAGIVQRYRPDAVITPSTGTVALSSDAPVALHPDLALLLTTSGSTGSPKLVRLTARGLRANATGIADYLALDSSERPLLHLPMSYSYGLSVIHSHMMVGAAICLTGHSVMEPGYWDDLRRFEATSIAGVPFHYTALRRFGEAKLDLPSLRTLTQAGGKLDPRVVTFFADWAHRTGRKFFVMYGQTEAGPRISYLPPEAATAAPEAIGVPVPGVTIELRDEDGALVPDGTPGEIVVRSPAVMMGYAEAAEDLALDDHLGGVLATGDLAVRGEDGLLRIVGRRSRILKIYGLRLNVDEVEQRLAERGYRTHCFGADDQLRVLAEGTAEAADVRAAIVELFSLPPRGIEVRVTPGIERTAAGKISATARDGAWDAAG